MKELDRQTLITNTGQIETFWMGSFYHKEKRQTMYQIEFGIADNPGSITRFQVDGKERANSEYWRIIGQSICRGYKTAQSTRLAYGTRSQQWHEIGPNDRDWDTAITHEEFYRLGEDAARRKYLRPTAL